MPNLSEDLRDYNATNNATGAHAIMRKAADALDATTQALIFVLGLEKLTTGEQAVLVTALIAAGVDLPEPCHADR